MASFYEDLALHAFAHQTLIRPVRRKMKQYLLSQIGSTGEDAETEDFVDVLRDMRRTPDAVAVLNPEKAKEIGLKSEPAILFIECEHTAPLTPEAVGEYVRLSMDADDFGVEYQISVAVVERYGRWQLLNLEALAFAIHVRNGLDLDFGLRSTEEVRKHGPLTAKEVGERLSRLGE